MQKNATAPYVQTPGKHHFCTLFVIMILHPLIESPKPPQYQIMGCLTLTVKRSSHQLTASLEVLFWAHMLYDELSYDSCSVNFELLTSCRPERRQRYFC